MKKVLIITYYWPPSGGAGVQRWLKFSKYLPEYGVQPVILTVDPAKASYAQVDKSLEHEVSSSVFVYKTNTFEPYNFYKKMVGKEEIPYGGFSNKSEETFLQKIAKAVRGNFFIPDPRKGWNRFAYRRAVELVREHRIDTVITTSPPHSTQLIGLKLKRELGIHWVADLRDPWTDIYYYPELHHSFLSRKLDQAMELKVLRQADVILTVSEHLKRMFIAKIDPNNDSKVIVIPNGYDEKDFELKVKASDAKFVITYTGTISEKYDINGFLVAISKLDEQKKKGILLRFVGNVSSDIVDKIRQTIPEVELDLVGYVGHSTSVGFLLRSSLQLLVIPKIKNNKGIVTGKFFEYLASRKPVLAIGPEGGDLEQLIDETECGKLFNYDDVNGMISVIDHLITDSFSLKDVPRSNAYSRKTLTGQLIQKLKL
ncbi:MAG TPA: glycosyltransferase family 4 protein [Sunxiuqinia sp.]|nr:glycosyltransferase family 4 protein [Sunxiuqinia sp.]